MFPLVFPAFSCAVLVGFPSWLAMFVVPACWLACCAARWSAVSCGCMCASYHVRSLFILAFGVCFFSCVLCPLPPSPVSFFRHWLIQCDRCLGFLPLGGGGGSCGWGAGREGHWGGLPPRAGVCVDWALGTQLTMLLTDYFGCCGHWWAEVFLGDSDFLLHMLFRLFCFPPQCPLMCWRWPQTSCVIRLKS